MKKRTLKFLITISLLVTLSTQAFSQNIMVVNRRHVDPENVPEFLHRIRTYWKEVRKKAIADDRLAGWDVYQRVGGFDLHKDHNFAVVSIYTPEQFAKGLRGLNDWEALFPDVKMEDIRVNTISTRHDQLFYWNLAYYEMGKPNILRVNFSKADKQDYFRMEPEIWGPFIDEQMKAGKTKVVSWAFFRLILPRGTETPHDAISVDGYNSLSDALLGSGFDDDVQFPENIEELLDAHHKADIHLYRHVASADDEESDEG